jgi:pimeloyl-[acyl-carrier protein] synthase
MTVSQCNSTCDGSRVGRRPVGRALRGALATPTLLAFVAAPRLRRNPHAAYRWLRRIDPVHQSPLGIWVLTRHQDVTAALRNPSLGSDETKADLGALRLGPLNRLLDRDETAAMDGPFLRVFSRLMLFRDPPDHTRLRSLVAKAFTPRMVQHLTSRISEIVEGLLTAAERNHRMELMREFAYPLPARVICELLDVPRPDEAFVIAQAPALAVGLDPTPMRPTAAIEAADRATLALTDYLEALIEQRRHHPGDDLLSALIAAEEGGERLDRDELVATLLLLLIAGHETTANLIGNGVHALLRHPAQLERLRNDPDVDHAAIEELLRYDGPVHMTERITLEPTTIGDATIPPGRILVVLLAAANRDPDVFTHPDRLDLARSPNPHVAFGGGPHFCVGASLARLEAQIAIPGLVRRFPSLRLSDQPPTWRPSFTIRGLREFQLTW